MSHVSQHVDARAAAADESTRAGAEHAAITRCGNERTAAEQTRLSADAGITAVADSAARELLRAQLALPIRIATPAASGAAVAAGGGQAGRKGQ